MSRIRSIHPGLWTDEAFVCLSPMARLLFMGIWNECDDMGSFEWSPLKLKMRLLPADSVDAAALLAEIEASGGAMRYEKAGKTYGAVRNFCQYQRPKKPNSVYPQTDEVRAWVNLDARTTRDGSSEEGSQLPTGGKKPRQMEDEGGDRETDLAEAKPVKARKRAPTPPEKPKGFDLPEWLPAEPWQAFVDMRREMERGPKKIPFTVGAAKGIVADLTGFHAAGHDIAAILMKSAINGYRGVFAPDHPQGEKRGAQKPLTDEDRASIANFAELKRSYEAGEIDFTEFMDRKSRPPDEAPRQRTGPRPIGSIISQIQDRAA